jgi:plastocyanin
LSAAVVVSLAACGGSSTSSSTGASSSSAPASSTTASSSAASSAPSGAAGSLSVAADPTGALKFTHSSLSASAGKTTITFTNASPLPHNFTLQQGTSGPVVGATPTFSGGSKTLEVTLKPGTYTYYCSVPGHRAAGMQGTLTVK